MSLSSTLCHFFSRLLRYCILQYNNRPKRKKETQSQRVLSIFVSLPSSPKTAYRGMLVSAPSMTAAVVVALVAILLSTAGTANAQFNFTCNPRGDQCPSAFDGTCDSNVGGNPQPGCETSDCADCDQCVQFRNNCEACNAAIGCYWCPGDATCYNSPFYTFGNVITECPTSLQFQSNDACTKPENVFK